MTLRAMQDEPAGGLVVSTEAGQHVFPASVSESDPGEPWVVLHTRSRQEKALAEELAREGIEHYLPVVRCVRFYGHRRREVRAPLFPSYLFMRGTREEGQFALATRRVARVIRVGDQGTFEHELMQIRQAVEGEAGLEPYRYLQAGLWVRVTSGPFKGVEGMVEEAGRRDRLVLRIQALGQATSMEIDPSLLERAD